MAGPTPPPKRSHGDMESSVESDSKRSKTKSESTSASPNDASQSSPGSGSSVNADTPMEDISTVSSNENGNSSNLNDEQNDASEENFDPRDDFYNRKIVALKLKLKEIKDGHCPEYIQKCDTFDDALKQELKEISADKELKIKCIENMFEYNKRAAEEICQTNKSDLQVDLMKELEDEIKEMEGCINKNRNSEGSRRVSKRNLRSKSAKPENGGVAGGVNLKTVHDGWEGPLLVGGTCEEDTLRYQLVENSIIEDLRKIHDDWSAAAVAFDKSLGPSFYTILVKCFVKIGKLYYGDDETEFNVGSEVVVANGDTNEEFAGMIVHISPREIIVKHNNGSKTRVLLRHLAQARASIKAVD